MAKQSLFRLHHEEAQRASRRLSWVFWLGACASGAIYFAISVALVEAIRFVLLNAEVAEGGWQIHSYSLWTGAAISGFCMLTLIVEYWTALVHLQRSDASTLALNMYAKPIDALKHRPRFAMASNLVQEMALAGGMPPPPVFYLPNDDSINAFVLGGKAQTVALVLSNGLLDYLNRDEQQAIIAHEFGHIKNEDVFIYAKLSAVLKGYYAISEWRHGGAIVSVARENIFSGLLRREDGRETIVDVIRNVLGTTGLVLAIIGEHIQAAFSREREWMADARAVQYTRNPEALVMAFKKALALQMLQMRTFTMPSNQAHYLFINYFEQMRTHPPLTERIERYGGKVDMQEIEALAYEIRTKRLSSPTDNPIELNRHAFMANAHFPILAVKAAQQSALPTAFAALKLREQLLAFFIYHSGMDSLTLAQHQKIAEQDKANLSQALLLVKRLTPIQHFSQFQKIAKTYQAQHSKAEQATLWAQIKQIMHDDGALNFYEICYAAQLQYTFQSPEQTKHYHDCCAEIHHVLRLVASMLRETVNWQEAAQPMSEAEQAACYAQLLKQSVPIAPEPFVSFDFSSQTQLITLYQSLRVLSEMRHSYRQALGQALAFHWQRQGHLTLQEVHLQQLLSALLA